MAGMTGLRLFLILMTLTLLSACATLERQPAVPQARRLDAKILDIPNARFFSDQVSLMSAEHERSLVREARRLGILSGALPTASFLSLSGGGMMAPLVRGCSLAGLDMVFVRNSRSSPVSARVRLSRPLLFWDLIMMSR